MLKSRIIFLLGLAASAMLAVGYDDKRAGFTVLYALLILCAFSAVCAALAPLWIIVSESAAQDIVFKDELFSYTVSIRNKGPFLYPRVIFSFHNPEIAIREGAAILCAIEPFGLQRREYSVHFPYRGIYSLGLESITVIDMLGLFRRTIRNKDPLRVTVYPENDEGFSLSSRNEPQNTSLHHDIFNEDYTSVADVRKYAPADSLRKIHWKLSAKRGELIAKTFQSYEPHKTILLLDTATINLTPRRRAEFEDKMVSYAASAVDCCSRGRLPAVLLYGDPDTDKMTVNAGAPIDGVYSLLAGIRFDRDKSPIYDVHRITGPYNLTAFLSDIDDNLYSLLKELVSFDHKLTIYCFLSVDRPLTKQKESLFEKLRAYGAEINPVAVGDYIYPAPVEGGDV